MDQPTDERRRVSDRIGIPRVIGITLAVAGFAATALGIASRSPSGAVSHSARPSVRVV